MLNSLVGVRHAPTVVAANVDAPHPPRTAVTRRIVLAAADLQPGLVLAENLRLREGFAPLIAGRVLDAALVRQIQVLEQRTGALLQVCVRAADGWGDKP